MSRSHVRRGLAIAGLGAAVFVALHGVFELGWERLFQPAALERAWFMASKKSLIVTQVTLGAIAVAIAVRRRGSWRRRLMDAGLLSFGALGAAIALFWLIGPEELMLGPADLWPLAFAAAFFLLAPAALAGILLGGYLRDRKK